MTKPSPAPGALCVATGCQASANLLAPVPLCSRHLREVYEFCTSLVDQRWADAVEQTRREPVVADVARPVGKNRHRLRPGWVYFILKDGLVKIGWSSQPRKRFYVLKPDRVLALTPGTMATEGALHEQFSHLRMHGEWFRPEADLLAFIDGVKAA